jgi:putative hydrolase of the HAD superfamily
LEIKAVVFDFIGTLAVVRGYSGEESVKKMHRSLVKDSFEVDYERFREVYGGVYRKYRLLRHEKLREVTNAVWLSETLNRLGFATEPGDEAVKKAVNVYFEGYLRSLKPRSCALRTLKKLSDTYSLGLVSNFTYAPVIHAGLRRLRLNPYFDAILVSQDVGWRKPHPKIFEEALKRLKRGAKQTVFVGDNPIEDIQGAKNVGMKAVFIPSQFFTVEDAEKASPKSDIILNSLCELPRVLSEIRRSAAKS